MKELYRKLRRSIDSSYDPRGFLLSKMPKGSVCAEIGAWQGDFSKRILDETSPKKLFLIDPYKHVPEYKKAWYGGDSGSQEKMDKVYNSVANRFASEIQKSQVEMKRNFSKEALATIEDQSLDWVYIDGDHTYEFVKEDLHLSWDKVKVGGYVTGDDYALKGWWDSGVTKAVDEFIAQNKARIGEVHIKSSQFIIEKIA